jgi:NADH:ubiquinone oxidoreductase subunit 5 (subunit L)/multisubunit Na+/H+ antiporter MnhA subunit
MNENLLNFPWAILFLPLLAAIFIALFTQKNRGLSAGISISAIVIGFLLSLILLIKTGASSVTSPHLSFEWLYSHSSTLFSRFAASSSDLSF